jgi:CubicO group peptidase (beta-lactamase class C family)
LIFSKIQYRDKRMNTKKLLLKLIAVLATMTLAFELFAVKPVLGNQVPGGYNQDHSYEEIDAYVDEQLKALNIPGASLAIIEGDKIVHVKGFGVSGPDGEAPTPQTPFIICSLTKSFTALAVMQLVEAGKIDLDAPVQRYLPWFHVADPQASAQITVRHLLNQTSGLSQTAGMIPLADFDDSPDATERQARGLATFALTRPVGSVFEYSNMNYNLLGLVIEAVSGETYADYIQSHIFTPLEMSHSYTSKAEAQQNDLAVGYQSWFGTPVAVPDLPVPSGSLPSGQLISSAEDMAHYLIAHLNEGRYGEVQILSPDGIAELHRPAVNAATMGVEMGEYGMGWFIEQTRQGTRIWHNGTAPDFFSYMALLPGQNRGIVLLVNANQMLINFALIEVGAGAASLLAGIQPESVPWGVIPWALRGFLLIPVFQVIGALATLRLIGRWRRDVNRRPGPIRMWVVYILLPLIPNLLLVALGLTLLGSDMLGFMLLFMPDLSWLALVCGGFALLWIFLRTGLILWTLRRLTPSQPHVGQLSAQA